MSKWEATFLGLNLGSDTASYFSYSVRSESLGAACIPEESVMTV